MAKLTYAQVSQLLKPDFETGKLYWRERTPDMFSDGFRTAEHSCNNWNASNAGKEAFANLSHGYRQGCIFDRTYKAHRVMWLLAHGEWPTKQIDHINRDRADNRPVNLRAASNAENCKNQSMPRNNTSGAVGVYWRKQQAKWRAIIIVNGKRNNLGCFNHMADAIEARKAAEEKFGFHPNHGR